METFESVLAELNNLREEVPVPPRKPSTEEVTLAEERLGKTFHPDFKRYLLEASDIVFGTTEPVTITNDNSHRSLFRICDNAWNKCLVPKEIIPICHDNGDFFCVGADGKVLYWSHNDGCVTEEWSSVQDWIKEVWIEENL